MISASFDALIVADPRFSGGSTSALVADVEALAALGLRLGLLFVRSGFLSDQRDPINLRAKELADLDAVTVLPNGVKARAEFAFLHHPMVFSTGIEERAELIAEKALVVAHHPPFRSDGSLEYNPLGTLRNVRKTLGLSAWMAPVSQVVRDQLSNFAPLLRQTNIDWPNIFSPADWPTLRLPFSGEGLTLGRHGRADLLKFPATGAEVDASLPASENIRIRVLGCPAEGLAAIGAHPDRWDVLPFGEEPVADFLNTLDIFSYHYHPRWQEAFGRTVVEAILCGRPCLLDNRLQGTFGNLAHYCQPYEVRAAAERLGINAVATRARVRTARQTAILRYGQDGMAERLLQLKEDAGQARRQGATTTLPVLARKILGHYRRRSHGAIG